MKIKIPVYVTVTAAKYIGDVEIEKPEDFDNAASEIWEENQEYISSNISNDFDVGDSDIEPLSKSDWEFHKNDQLKGK